MVLATVGVATILCFIASLIEFASPLHASFSDVEPDRRDLPTLNSGELGGSSVLSCVWAMITSAQNVYC